MKASNRQFRLALVIAGSLLGCSLALAQAPMTQPPAQGQQQGQQQGKQQGNQQAAPLTLDSTPPPVTAEEEAAFKSFNEAPQTDLAKKDQAGNDFLQKYPQSRYRAQVYSWQVKYYYQIGDIDKMEAAADKEIELFPNDAQTLAIAGSALPRKMNGTPADQQKRLEKAEQYSQKALDLLPTFQKPDNMSDEMFTQAKNQTSALAYSGLGLVAFRRGKFADAIPNLEKAIQLDPQPDAVNYYLLGICNEKTSHFDEAVTDFTKCSNIPSGLQANCKNGIDEAKKLGATQLSAPK